MTIISHAHKFIFICPRKIAGTSIQVSLSRSVGEDDIVRFGPRGRTFDRRLDETDFRPRARANGHLPWRGDGGPSLGQHDLPDMVREEVGESVWQAYFKFTVARNPWDLLVSYLYHKFGPLYWRHVWWTGRPPVEFLGNIPRALRLHRLRGEFLRGRGRQSIEHILREGLFDAVEQMPQFYFSRGARFASRVLRFETLQQDYDDVCERLGLPCRVLPRVNTKTWQENHDYRDYYTDFSRAYVADVCRSMIDAFGYRFDDAEQRVSNRAASAIESLPPFGAMARSCRLTTPDNTPTMAARAP